MAKKNKKIAENEKANFWYFLTIQYEYSYTILDDNIDFCKNVVESIFFCYIHICLFFSKQELRVKFSEKNFILTAAFDPDSITIIKVLDIPTLAE